MAQIPEIDPWGVGIGGEVETESSEDEEPLPVATDTGTTERPQIQGLGETLSVPLSSLKLDIPQLPTPAPSPTRGFRPISNIEGVPGAFPGEAESGGAAVQTPAKGVDLSRMSPEDQLRSELECQLEDDLDTNSPPPPGYRARGDLAPRDINADFSESNILTSKRARKRTSHLATMAAVVHSGQEEDTHKGVLLAFSTAIGSSRSQEVSSRDDLPPEPKHWSEIINHPHCESFVKATELEIETLRKKEAFIEVDKPTDQSVQILPLK
ncbi:uncharacterized protein N7496_010275 [Penicillium cataractarum]|uniref:Uncharacterized protein n=1 Tax=Penicillium cataractarum TaxID=2100454 RepID=A0A9W9RQS0_9EURO|nr:uncharacterized protein N7496_010275 [Penicillium cataractarum]KAJ5364562.1 hypothetical protein N7496_010275 [Penicillium cataractarum]